jgi:hypothetical protein
MTFPYGMIELQVELNSLKECGRKASHYGIMCIEILKNHVYHPHVRPMECAAVRPMKHTFLRAKDVHVIQGITIIHFSKF